MDNMRYFCALQVEADTYEDKIAATISLLHFIKLHAIPYIKERGVLREGLLATCRELCAFPDTDPDAEAVMLAQWILAQFAVYRTRIVTGAIPRRQYTS